jgi:hypothetical protein
MTVIQPQAQLCLWALPGVLGVGLAAPCVAAPAAGPSRLGGPPGATPGAKIYLAAPRTMPLEMRCKFSDIPQKM